MFETEPKQRRESKKESNKRLYTKSALLIDQYSVPFFDPLLLRFGVEIMPAAATTPVATKLVINNQEEFGKLAIVRSFPDRSQFPYVMAFFRSGELYPQPLFQFGEEETLNPLGQAAKLKELFIAQDLMNYIEKNLQVSRAETPSSVAEKPKPAY